MPPRMSRKRHVRLLAFATVLGLVLLNTLGFWRDAGNDGDVLALLSHDQGQMGSKHMVDPEFVRTNLFGTALIHDSQISQELLQDHSLVYAYDPRVTRAIYFHHITEVLQKTQDPEKISIPFSWYDWVDIASALNRFVSLPNNAKFDCSLICTAMNKKPSQLAVDHRLIQNGSPPYFYSEDKQLKSKPNENEIPFKKDKLCSKYCLDDKSSGQPGFRVFDNLFKVKSRKKSALHSRSYLYSVAKNPASLVIITKGGNLEILLRSNSDKRYKKAMNMKNERLVKDYVNQKGTLHVNSLHEYQTLLEVAKIAKSSDAIKFTDYRVELSHERFLFDAPRYLQGHPKPETAKEINFQNSLKASLNRKESTLRKHFIEVSLPNGASGSSHYDWRFFNGVRYTDEERHAILSRMLKTWFEFTGNDGIVSWLSHGGLLAHSFNGIQFPWDDDIDVQLPFQDFMQLARDYNNSLIIEDPEVGFGSYFLDITDSATHRIKGNTLNNIDGRFIDTQSGLFIDLTALAVSSSDLPLRYKTQFDTLDILKPVEFIDPNIIINDMYEAINANDKKIIAKDDPTTYSVLRKAKGRVKKPGLTKELDPKQRFDINYKLKVYSCRNEHFYELRDLSPLRLTYFDKIPIYVPNEVQKILSLEYRQQYWLSNVFHDHVFLPQLRLWIPVMTLKNVLSYTQDTDPNLYTKEEIMKLLEDETTLRTFKATHHTTLVNEKERYIITDSDITNQDTLLEELMGGQSLKPLHKDIFTSQLEKATLKSLDLRQEAASLLSEMQTQLSKEYAGSADYYDTQGETMDEATLNFNDISWTHKKILQLYQADKFDPDYKLRKKILEESSRGSQSSKMAEKITGDLEKLEDKGRTLEKLKVSGLLPNLATAQDLTFPSTGTTEKDNSLDELDEEVILTMV